MRLLESTKKDVDVNKNGEIEPKLESLEVVSLLVLFSFVPNKQFGQLINIKQNSLIMMDTVNTEFSHIEVWFTGESSKALEIEDNINLTLIIGQSSVANNV